MASVPSCKSATNFLKSTQAFQPGVSMILVAGQNEVPPYAFGGDEFLKQRRGELHRSSTKTAGVYVPDRSPVVIEVLFGRNAKMKFVSIQILQLLLRKTPARRQAMDGLPEIRQHERLAQNAIHSVGKQPRWSKARNH